MNDNGSGLGFFGWLLVLAPVLVLLSPAMLGLYNTVSYPGYETCKKKINRGLRDPDSADYSWPPRRFNHRSDPDMWRYVIEVRSTNGFGGVSVQRVGCSVDDRGAEPRYSVEW